MINQHSAWRVLHFTWLIIPVVRWLLSAVRLKFHKVWPTLLSSESINLFFSACTYVSSSDTRLWLPRNSVQRPWQFCRRKSETRQRAIWSAAATGGTFCWLGAEASACGNQFQKPFPRISLCWYRNRARARNFTGARNPSSSYYTGIIKKKKDAGTHRWSDLDYLKWILTVFSNLTPLEIGSNVLNGCWVGTTVDKTIKTLLSCIPSK